MFIENVDGLKTGDIVLFSGRCRVSRTIKFLTRSKWSHVGIVVVTKEHGLCVYESSHDARIRCLDRNRRTIGVQLLPFWKRIENYEGPISVRRLEGIEEDRLNMNAFNSLRKEFVGRAFEENFWQLLRAWNLPFFKNMKEYLSSIFCTELSAASYQVMGILCKCRPSNGFSPKEFSEKGSIELMQGAYLGPEIRIKF